MTALPAQKAEIVRAMVAAAPDHAVRRLFEALQDAPAQGPLGDVRTLVEAEADDRRRRDAAFQPVLPLFGGTPIFGRPNFAPRVLRQLWSALNEAEPELVAALRFEGDDDAQVRQVFDAQEALCARAASGLRQRDTPAFAAAAEGCDAQMLAACLDLSLVVRRTLPRLTEWLNQRTADTAAAARLAYKDAVTVADDATPRFFQMVAAHLPQPWMILRIISSVMDKPNERYLHDSELANFAEAVLDDIDAALKVVAAFRGSDGPDAALAAARLCELAVRQIMEIEGNVDLNRETGWGRRLHKQRAALASSVEARLREAEKATLECLPLHTGRGRRGPRLDGAPAPLSLDQALTLATFSSALQSAANHGGFSAARNRMVETVGEHLDLYVEEALDALRGDADPALVRAYLDIAADIARVVRGEEVAKLIRRRAQAALSPDIAA